MTCPDENLLVAFADGRLDPGAHARVAEHLDACPDCASLVADAALAVGEPSNEATKHVTPAAERGKERGPLPRGTVLGRYVLLDLIGRGGLGQVYTAYDPELDRKVAIKLLRPSNKDVTLGSDAQRWLMREAQAMAQLSHPNVVPVHDVGTYGDQVFIAMKLVEGGTLRAWLKEQPRDWKAIRDVLYAAGQGLSAAHAAGLVHRDFKPGNLLVDREGTAYVVDFGLARAVAGPPSEQPIDPLTASPDRLLDEDLTETGAIIGTPAYMAPEQLTGREIDPRADQFAFCVTLYEALWRRRPFNGRTLGELFEAIEAGPPNVEPPEPVPLWLRRAITQGLSAQATDRFADMQSLLLAMTRDQRSRRRQWAAIGGVAVVSAAIAGVAGFAMQPELSPRERDAVETIAEQARAAAARAYFIYPPQADPDFPTAYVKVLELEGMGAGDEASELRHEFAETLLRLGDSYWDREGGKAFASDYYAAAVVFDPEQKRALQRMQLTPGQVGALESRASALSFSESELIAAGALVALAEPDEDVRARRVADWAARGVGPVATHVQLERLYPRGAKAASEPSKPVIVAEADEPETAAEEASDPRRTRRPASKPEPAAPKEPAAARDPKAAAAEVALGKAALGKGKPGEAATHFHRALEHDPKNHSALAGLSRVHFERSEYGRAVKFGERAIRSAPKNAAYRMALGDAYLNVLRYGDARRQYEKARDLGHSLASKRLDQLAKKVGEK